MIGQPACTLSFGRSCKWCNDRLFAWTNGRCPWIEGGSLILRIPWYSGTRSWQNSEIVCRFHHPPLWFIKYGCLWWLWGRVTHQRRGHDIHTVVSFTEETYLLCTREMLLSIETDPNERYVTNRYWEKENVTWLTNMSGHAYVNIVNMAVETSLQHAHCISLSSHLLCTGGGG